ncbi:MAG: phenylalanine--tRNA ligase beta subunit-related protein [Candidatus Woesearchaeota archaeon]
MKFIIEPEIFRRFPDLIIGVLVAKNLNNESSEQRILDELRNAEISIKEKFSTETLSQAPRIDCWRKAYSSFGAKPKENKSSVESLYRMVLQEKNIKHINKLVDIYNLISLKHMLPAGGEDTDKAKGDIRLAFAGENEPAVLLLGDTEPRPPHKGEIIYKDDISAICRRWNWREADRTKLTEETKNCIIVIEGLSPANKEDISAALKELQGLIKKFCNAETEIHILEPEKNETEITS